MEGPNGCTLTRLADYWRGTRRKEGARGMREGEEWEVGGSRWKEVEVGGRRWKEVGEGRKMEVTVQLQRKL
jgi:hypothetical protein